MKEEMGFKLSDDDTKELGIAIIGLILGIIGLIVNGQNIRELITKGLANGDS